MTRLRTALIIAAVIAGGAVASSQATPPGRNGRIAFMRQDAAGDWQVWVANSDLSGAKELTHGRSAGGWGCTASPTT